MTEVKQIDTGTVELARGKTVGGTWQVVRKLGEGGCGSVYLVKNLEDDSEAAMKAESNTAAGGCVLKLEVAILKKLSGKPHVAQFLFAARLMDFSYVIMTLLGESLNKLVKRVGRQITVSSQVRIAANTLFCLKQMHDIGFIHRDLKPANMALGYKSNSEECRFLHILDFGLARQYAVPHSEQPSKLMMRRPRERSLFRGTTRYCSIRMHDRSEQGRVDDLWSMLYLLAELRGPLPWANQW
uniref:Protein kinase domain-containing protein n=1 Tax=Caenorhabditis japonica TaxID=281687 RepID=A0A8R1DU46_CAEJA